MLKTDKKRVKTSMEIDAETDGERSRLGVKEKHSDTEIGGRFIELVCWLFDSRRGRQSFLVGKGLSDHLLILSLLFSFGFI